MYAIDTEAPAAALDGASTSARTRSPGRPPACAGRWPRPRWATTSTGRTRRSRALEERVAELFGHEDALFVPSGTMGNQIGLRLVCQPGEEILGDADCHVLTYELGAAAAIFGLSSRTVVERRRPAGRRPADRAGAPPRRLARDPHGRDRRGEHAQPRRWAGPAARRAAEAVGLVAGGRRRRPPRRGADLERRRRHGQGPRHLRPARRHRVGLPVQGPGTPVGSVLVASAERIAAARLWRKRLGGGMRQAGILAAAGLYALDHHLERLADDHEQRPAAGRAARGRPGVGRDEHRRRWTA